jgi:N-acetylglucosaminyl-diphospho-decaprenol L-rhamnosyltransferase
MSPAMAGPWRTSANEAASVVADIVVMSVAVMKEDRIIDAIVIAFHGDRWLAPCVEFLENDHDAGVRVVIGDNHGNTVVTALTNGHSVVSVSLPGPLGFAEANNLTLVKLGFQARYVCFLNQDTKSPKGWLTRVSAFLDTHPDIGAVTPLVSTYDGEGWDPNFVACANSAPAVLDRLQRLDELQEFYAVPVIPAPAMVVRTSVLRMVGGFDPIYGSYYEDYDLCNRIRDAGYRIGIWTGATIAHYSGSATTTAEADHRRQRQIVRNRIIYRVRSARQRRPEQLAREWLVELPRQPRLCA